MALAVKRVRTRARWRKNARAYGKRHPERVKACRAAAEARRGERKRVRTERDRERDRERHALERLEREADRRAHPHLYTRGRKYLSDRPCPICGARAPVPRYLKGDGCVTCRLTASERQRAKETL